MTATSSQNDATIRIRESVREKYGDIARDVLQGTGEIGDDPITGGLYSGNEAQVIPLEALQASLGCGNPTALAELRPGETVLDLGSGGGIDVLLSARRVGRTGFAYGLDMTDEMLALAEQNKAEAGAENVAVPQGAHRGHPAAGCRGRRDHLQLRHQSGGGQGAGAARGVPRAQSGRPLRRLRRGGPGRAAGRPARRHGGLGRLRRRRAGGERVPPPAGGCRLRRRRASR